MRSISRSGGMFACVLLVTLGAGPLAAAAAGPSDKVAITTSSEAARKLYLQGRDLAEKLRATDARRYYEQAVAADKGFALGYVGLANTSGTTKEFIDATTRAAALAGQVSEGERHIVLALEAGMKGDPAGALAHFTELVRLFPNDERAQTLLGNAYFGRQDYETAVKHFVKATSINPSFTQPYNQMGYAYRFLERFDDAENAFKKYTQLIPDDPNPYDSYAELLMKMGRFDESIKLYEKALSIDPNFVASYVGIGNDHLCMGHYDQARAAFAKLAVVARNTGERRQARFWTAAAYVHEGATDKAIAELQASSALAEAEHDGGSMSARSEPDGRRAARGRSIRRRAGEVRRVGGAHREGAGAGIGEGGDAPQPGVRAGTRGRREGRPHDREGEGGGVREAGGGQERALRGAAAARAERPDRAGGKARRRRGAGIQGGEPAGSARSSTCRPSRCASPVTPSRRRRWPPRQRSSTASASTTGSSGTRRAKASGQPSTDPVRTPIRSRPVPARKTA